MTDFQAAILGFIQGATEWLPISSTAHLRIIPALIGWKDPGAAFTAVIQWGTVLAALVYFRKDILRILFNIESKGKDDIGSAPDNRLLIPIVVGTLPIVVFGLLLKHKIEHEWRSLYVISGALIGLAILLWLAELGHKEKRQMGSISLWDGLLVGIGQAFALIPGASRSGTTITAALFSGLERSTAARFSFLLSLPAVTMAGVKEFWDSRHEIMAHGEMRPILIAIVVAFIVGLASIDWLLKYLRRHPTYVFVVYRIALGVSLLILLAKGIIPATDATDNQNTPAPIVKTIKQ